ncbi:Inactive tyrosine-protein kinase 7, variant 3 [Clonorchis sinensis]|uniref:Inactive tyrosine-protein kinase 7, variant 3 n=2 Tax=Clonorchis sinensis TaxID=79923 RepID=A0A8T1MQ39_CLOSI|nr:Inactive tyrosine-protein kinase 7, variant 3 [Clonorchis sinensis]
MKVDSRGLLEYFGICILLWPAVVFGASSDGFYFTVNPNDQDVEEGQPLRLRCAVTPSKDIYYSWLHNGDRVDTEKENGRRTLEVDSNLQILHADRDLDPGTYQCQALNRSSTFTTASQEAKVNIYWMEPDVQVRLVRPTRYEDIQLGQELEFACHASANPPLSPFNIKWYHNGNARLPNTEVRQNGNLHIAVLGVEHIGSYHCRAVHAAGKLDSRPPFVIQFNDANPPQLVTTLVHEDFSKFVMRGRSVELICPKIGAHRPVDGIPPITVWGYMPRLGEQQQSITSIRDTKLVDMDSKLVITNFDIHHVNYYTCEISSYNSPDKYVFLFQVEMATLYTPTRADFSPRLKKSQPYVVKINDDAELRYYSDQSPANSFFADQMSNPAPRIEWHKQGEHQPIVPWAPPVLTHGPVTHTPQRPRRYALRGRHLIVHQVAEADSGTYEMTLSNIVGRVSITFDLLVTFPPEFYQPLTHEEHSFDEDETLTLNCGIKRRALPGSVVYWEKDQRVLRKYDSHLVLEENGEQIRFTKLRPEDQGQYQCFVQTDGYNKRAAGREQTLVVKGKLQFLREIRKHFLEVNTQGRIPCKVRGYGTLKIDWFRKVGNRPSDFLPIHPPNQVEPGGTLVIQYVRKSDAGEYVCLAHSSYKNAQINMTVNVVVGEKPQISQISSNQTVSVGKQVVLNCHATGDPLPQISWIAKRIGFTLYTPKFDPNENGTPEAQSNAGVQSSNSELQHTTKPDGSMQDEANSDPVMAALLSRNAPTDQSRVKAYPNGSLVINQANLLDQAEYICVANNTHAVEARLGLFVRVLSAEDYTRQQLGEEGSGSSMLKTILTVVGCAVTYLGLIIALTVFCSMRMVRTRRKRSHKVPKAHENGQLLTQLGEPNCPNGAAGNSQDSGGCHANTLDSGFFLQGTGSGASAPGSASFGPLPGQPQIFHPHYHRATDPLLGTISSGRNYQDSDGHRNATSHSSITPNGMGSACSQLPSVSQQDSQEWWPWKNQGFFNAAEMQLKVPHGTPASPLEMISEPNPDSVGLNSHEYMHSHQINMPGCAYLYNGRNNGIENSTNATTASDSQLMSAPPPTPLDSRSHFSGISSGNSTSLYSRSLLSGASNVGPSPRGDGAQTVNDNYSPYGVVNGASTISQANRMHYPRCELKVEGILGKGVFGDVFLARARHIQEEEMQSLVLVKSLISHESSHINEFHRQLEMFGKLNHDCVARLLGVCMEQEPFYMLLEYCEWGDLKMFLRRIRESDAQTCKLLSVTYAQKLKMCHKLACGMEHFSQLRCVHRDLAARNILLTQEMDLKISSLGLARDVYASEYYHIPNGDQFLPLRWLAPELIVEALPISRPGVNANQLDYGHSFAGPSLPYTIQSDVWAFAVVVCEIFSLATLPLSRLTDQEIIVAGRHTALTAHENIAKDPNHVPLRPDIPAEIPPELSNLLLRCWSPVARQRPDFREVVSVLRDLVP